MLKFDRITLSGFKSIDSEGQTVDFGDITVFIGANGAGKSNLVSFFDMIFSMAIIRLELYTNLYGSATSILHYGPEKTKLIAAELSFSGDKARGYYRFKLAHAAGDIFIFDDEELEIHYSGFSQPKIINLGAGHKESKLIEPGLFISETITEPEPKDPVNDRVVCNFLLENCSVYQFNDTTLGAKIRNKCDISDDTFMYGNAGNLVAILYAMKNNEKTNKYYNRIVSRINAVFPQFEDFVLEPSKHNPNQIILKWKDKESQYTFGSHQISDGTLRFMALATLLLQPPEWLPKVIIIDEPELGLHPTAISDLAGMVKSASRHVQVILATQSPRLVDEFEPNQIVVVDYNDKLKRSEFNKLNESDLAEWLDRYTLSELWDKNVIGGNP
ncbi:MAG: AAA family ATPase [Nitrospirae bacterium]|nr:AAA family ATPase [Nitrospirota bacterium]